MMIKMVIIIQKIITNVSYLYSTEYVNNNYYSKNYITYVAMFKKKSYDYNHSHYQYQYFCLYLRFVRLNTNYCIKSSVARY